MDPPGGGVSSEDEDGEDGTASPSEDEGETGHEAGAARPLRRTPRLGAAKEPGALFEKGIIAPHKRKKRGPPPKKHKPSKRARAKARNSEAYRKRTAAKKAAWVAAATKGYEKLDAALCAWNKDKATRGADIAEDPTQLPKKDRVYLKHAMAVHAYLKLQIANGHTGRLWSRNGVACSFSGFGVSPAQVASWTRAFMRLEPGGEFNPP